MPTKVKFERTIIDATDENIERSLQNDELNRHNTLINFIQGLVNSPGNVCIALDSPWGSGKTFFVKQSQHVIERKSIGARSFLARFNQQLDEKQLKHLIPIYYDAWKNDDSIDPLFSVVYTVLEAAKHSIDHGFEKTDSKKLIETITEWVTKIPVSKLSNNISAPTELYAYFQAREKTQKEIQKTFESIIESQRNALHLDDNTPMKIVLFIDELDRCSPDFAIKLLERIKHYVDNPHVIFVLSVNLQELHHTIKKFYGSEFSATSYLDRFFDVRLSLQTISKDFLNHILKYDDEYIARKTVVNAVMDYFSFELREKHRYIKWCEWLKRNFDKEYYTGRSICNQIMIPYMIGLKMKDADAYQKFINGDSCTEFVDFFKENIDLKYITRLFVQAPYYTGYENSPGEVLQILRQLYSFVWRHDISAFSKDDILENENAVMLKHATIQASTKEYILNSISLLC